MSLDKIGDIAEAVGPQTMVSRIGKMPMEIHKTLFGPIKSQQEKQLKYTSVGLRHESDADPNHHKEANSFVLPKLNASQIKSNPYRQRNDQISKLSNNFPIEKVRESVATSMRDTQPIQQTVTNPYKNNVSETMHALS